MPVGIGEEEAERPEKNERKRNRVLRGRETTEYCLAFLF